MAKVNDMVVFVPYVVPGDVVDLQVKRKKNKYAEAVAVKFHEFSPKRAVPFCQHYGVCGGCKWQCLTYEDQIKYKQKQVTDNLTRIGKVELPEISPILGSEKTEFYRNKLEFTFSDKRWLTEEEVKAEVQYDQMNAVGFHIPGAFDKVLAIEKCWLQDDISNQIRNTIRDYAYENGLAFYNIRNHVEYGLYAKEMGGGSVNPVTGEFNFAVNEGYIVRNGVICEPVRGASLVGKGSDVIQNIDMVGSDMEMGQGMCGSSSGSVPTNVGQPLIRVSSITVGGR